MISKLIKCLLLSWSSPPCRSTMASRGALWVHTHSTMLPHQVKKRAEVGGEPAATAALQLAPWGPPRDAKAAWLMLWTHWNNARWRNWSKASQKVSDENPDVSVSLARRHDFYYPLLSSLSSSVISPLCLFLLYSVLNPLMFRQEQSLCLSRIQTDSFSCLGLLSAMLCIFITTWQVRCALVCMCSCVNVGRLKKIKIRGCVYNSPNVSCFNIRRNVWGRFSEWLVSGIKASHLFAPIFPAFLMMHFKHSNTDFLHGKESGTRVLAGA